MSKDIFALSEADIDNIISNCSEVSDIVKFSDIEGLFSPNFLTYLDGLKENKASFEDKIYENIETVEAQEFVDMSDYEKLRIEEESHLIDNLIVDFEDGNFHQSNNHRLWDKEGSLTMSLSTNNEMRAKKENSMLVEIACKILFNKCNQESQESDKLKFAEEYFTQIKENYLAEKNNGEYSVDNWGKINFNLLLSYIENGSDFHNGKVFGDFVEKLFSQLCDLSCTWTIKYESLEDYKQEKNYMMLIKALVENQSTNPKAALVAMILAFRLNNLHAVVYCLKNVKRNLEFKLTDVKRLIGPEIKCIFTKELESDNSQMRFCDYKDQQAWIFDHKDVSKRASNMFANLNKIMFKEFKIVDNLEKESSKPIDAAIVYEKEKGAIKLLYEGSEGKNMVKSAEYFKFKTEKYKPQEPITITVIEKPKVLEKPADEFKFGFFYKKVFSIKSLIKNEHGIGYEMDSKGLQNSISLKKYSDKDAKFDWFISNSPSGCHIHSKSNPRCVWTVGSVLKPTDNDEILEFDMYNIVLKKYARDSKFQLFE